MSGRVGSWIQLFPEPVDALNLSTMLIHDSATASAPRGMDANSRGACQKQIMALYAQCHKIRVMPLFFFSALPLPGSLRQSNAYEKEKLNGISGDLDF